MNTCLVLDFRIQNTKACLPTTVFSFPYVCLACAYNMAESLKGARLLR